MDGSFRMNREESGHILPGSSPSAGTGYEPEGGRVCVVTLGCARNLVDTEVMLGSLMEAGYSITTDRKEADILIVNTCGFIADAREESIDTIVELAEYKKEGRCRMLVVAGCMSQRYSKELERELPEADLFVGTGSFHRIAELISASPERKTFVTTPEYIYDYHTPRLLSTPRGHAYVKIAEGCVNRCSYCVIPDIRGELRSRSPGSIMEEVRSLAAHGIKEVNLVAQDTTSYGTDRGYSLEALLKGLAGVEGVEWIRLLYLYPGRITDRLMTLIREEPKICPYIDLPIQHIDERILRLMDRHYRRDDVMGLLERLRKSIPGVVLRTTLIVGFPTEGEEEFGELLSFVKEAEFDRLGVFTYSREEGTPAFSMDGQIPEEVKEERAHRIMEAQREISARKNRLLHGRRLKVLVDGHADEGIYRARYSGQAPEVDGMTLVSSCKPLAAGDMPEVVITHSDDYDLFATPVDGRVQSG